MSLLWSLYGGQSRNFLDFLVESQQLRALYTVSAAQAWYYFHHQKDRWVIKLVVGPIFLAYMPPTETIPGCCRYNLWHHPSVSNYPFRCFSCISFSGENLLKYFPRVLVYTYVITNWGNPAYLERIVWSAFTLFRCQFPNHTLFLGISSRSMLVSKIWPLSKTRL